MRADIFLIICLTGFRRIRNVADKSYRENRKTRFIFNKVFFNCAVNEICGKIL